MHILNCPKAHSSASCSPEQLQHYYSITAARTSDVRNGRHIYSRKSETGKDAALDGFSEQALEGPLESEESCAHTNQASSAPNNLQLSSLC